MQDRRDCKTDDPCWLVVHTNDSRKSSIHEQGYRNVGEERRWIGNAPETIAFVSLGAVSFFILTWIVLPGLGRDLPFNYLPQSNSKANDLKKWQSGRARKSLYSLGNPKDFTSSLLICRACRLDAPWPTNDEHGKLPWVARLLVAPPLIWSTIYTFEFIFEFITHKKPLKGCKTICCVTFRKGGYIIYGQANTAVRIGVLES